MKTIEEFVKEIGGSKELQKAVGEIKDKASLTAFLKANDCDATAEDFVKFVKSNSEGELSDDAAGEVAGGIYFPRVPWPSPYDPKSPDPKSASANFDW